MEPTSSLSPLILLMNEPLILKKTKFKMQTPTVNDNEISMLMAVLDHDLLGVSKFHSYKTVLESLTQKQYTRFNTFLLANLRKFTDVNWLDVPSALEKSIENQIVFCICFRYYFSV
jgi:hypothetical protein